MLMQVGVSVSAHMRVRIGCGFVKYFFNIERKEHFVTMTALRVVCVCMCVCVCLDPLKSLSVIYHICQTRDCG